MQPGRNPAFQETGILLLSIFLISICGIIYELIIGGVASYLMGNSVYQFSITIGLFMSAMGVGSFLSRQVKAHLLDAFIIIEVLIALLGGFSAFFLFLAYSVTDAYPVVMFLIIILIGTLVGLEIPILTRLVEERYHSLRISLANVLSFDYIGALVGSVAFPILLLPKLGLLGTAFAVGGLNMAVVAITTGRYFSDLRFRRQIVILSIIVLGTLAVGASTIKASQTYLEQRLYEDKVIYSEQTKYQKIILTRRKDDLRLYLDGNLQFSSVDEYRYHEALVHPAMSLAPIHKEILILGGGDGLAAREVLKYQDLGRITLVDLDQLMTELARQQPDIVALNHSSLKSPKVRMVHQDAYKFLEKTTGLFNVIVIDLPDPNNEALNKLYTLEFYQLVQRHLAKGGVVVVQSTSPYFASKPYWSIRKTVAATGLYTTGYHVDVPSFGDWGFTIASNLEFNPDQLRIKVPNRFLDNGEARAMFVFSKDLHEADVEVNRLSNPVMPRYYEQSWRHW